MAEDVSGYWTRRKS